jgi:hypothetical protein
MKPATGIYNVSTGEILTQQDIKTGEVFSTVRIHRVTNPCDPLPDEIDLRFTNWEEGDKLRRNRNTPIQINITVGLQEDE